MTDTIVRHESGINLLTLNRKANTCISQNIQLVFYMAFSVTGKLQIQTLQKDKKHKSKSCCDSNGFDTHLIESRVEQGPKYQEESFNTDPFSCNTEVWTWPGSAHVEHLTTESITENHPVLMGFVGVTDEKL